MFNHEIFSNSCMLTTNFTLTGKCLNRFTNKKTPYCVRFNPDEDKQNLFVVGCSDKKIYCVCCRQLYIQYMYMYSSTRMYVYYITCIYMYLYIHNYNVHVRTY